MRHLPPRRPKMIAALPAVAAAVAAVAAGAQPASAAPFAVTLLTPESIQMVDLGSVQRSDGTVTYRTVMMVQPSPDLAEGKLSYLAERREARCATGEVRRLSMSADIGEDDDLAMPIPDDPWTPLDAAEKQIVCDPAHRSQQVLPTLADARTMLTGVAPPP